MSLDNFPSEKKDEENLITKNCANYFFVDEEIKKDDKVNTLEQCRKQMEIQDMMIKQQHPAVWARMQGEFFPQNVSEKRLEELKEVEVKKEIEKEKKRDPSVTMSSCPFPSSISIAHFLTNSNLITDAEDDDKASDIGVVETVLPLSPTQYKPYPMGVSSRFLYVPVPKMDEVKDASSVVRTGPNDHVTNFSYWVPHTYKPVISTNPPVNLVDESLYTNRCEVSPQVSLSELTSTSVFVTASASLPDTIAVSESVPEVMGPMKFELYPSGSDEVLSPVFEFQKPRDLSPMFMDE